MLFLALVIIAVIASDFMAGRPNKSKPNPYAFDISEYKNVDPELILYKESKNFLIGIEEPVSIDVYEDKIFVTGDNKLKIIDSAGTLLLEINLSGKPQTAEIYDNNIFLAVDNRILVYDLRGGLLNEWESLGPNSLITAIAVTADNVFVADAGNRRILRYSEEGDLKGEFDGKANEGILHGFIVPSPVFDMDINDIGELWVVNPGLHALENYTYDGHLRSHWKRTSINPEGFSGCCNPAFFAFLDDGRYVTSEKGLVRVKTYKRSGELEGVVAAPVQFMDDGRAPDVATDSRNNIYALDFDKKLIRVFEPK